MYNDLTRKGKKLIVSSSPVDKCYSFIEKKTQQYPPRRTVFKLIYGNVLHSFINLEAG